jgi:heat shock protein HtpX
MRASSVPIRRPLAPLDAAEQRRHKRRNLLQSVLLTLGMVGLLALCGWLLFGAEGIVGLGLGAVFALAMAPRVSPRMVLRLYSAQPLMPEQLPAVFDVLARLTERAGLARIPRLYYVRSALLNAFAVGGPNDAAIALTDGMLRHLDLRELAGVLAHEISHIRNRDLWLMNLADLAGRLTRVMSLLGIGLLIVGLPLWLSGAAELPWLPVPLLLFAPQLTMLLQLALSRSREFDADLDAAGLTGDPAASRLPWSSSSATSAVCGSESCCRAASCLSRRCCAAIRRPASAWRGSQRWPAWRRSPQRRHSARFHVQRSSCPGGPCSARHAATCWASGTEPPPETGETGVYPGTRT